jgi:hypothetical protein
VEVGGLENALKQLTLKQAAIAEDKILDSIELFITKHRHWHLPSCNNLFLTSWLFALQKPNSFPSRSRMVNFLVP